jgi:hypothetical protein
VEPCKTCGATHEERGEYAAVGPCIRALVTRLAALESRLESLAGATAIVPAPSVAIVPLGGTASGTGEVK